MLFQEAEGHPVRREGLHRFPLGTLSKIKPIWCETQVCCWFYNLKSSSKVLFRTVVRESGPPAHAGMTIIRGDENRPRVLLFYPG